MTMTSNYNEASILQYEVIRVHDNGDQNLSLITWSMNAKDIDETLQLTFKEDSVVAVRPLIAQ